MIETALLHTKGKFSDAYRTLRDSAGRKVRRGVSDAHTPYGGTSPQDIREHLVRCIWFDRRLKADALALDDGRRMSIISQGRWNLGKGPDFNHAEIIIDGKRRRGDIEIHTYSSDWYKHNHSRDSAYNRLILHVVMFNDRSIESIKRYDGADVAQITLSRFLERPLAELAASMDISEYPHNSEAAGGECMRALAKIKGSADWTTGFLDLAGDWRMLDKSARFEALLRVNPPEEVLFFGLMEASGYPLNKTPFRRLASLVSHESLRRLLLRPKKEESLLSGLAVLSGCAGLIPDISPGMDSDTIEIVSNLRAEWEKARPDLRCSAMEKSEWRFGGTRPQNYPYRRIAAVAALYAAVGQRSLFGEIMKILSDASRSPRARRKAIEKLLSGADEAAQKCPAGRYWLRRNIFGGKPAGAARRFFSANMTGIIAINILVPLYLAFARKTGDADMERALHGYYRDHPRLPASGVTRFMERRIFGRDSEDSRADNARRQQALYQIYRDCCEHNDTHCESCVFMKAIKS